MLFEQHNIKNRIPIEEGRQKVVKLYHTVFRGDQYDYLQY